MERAVVTFRVPAAGEEIGPFEGMRIWRNAGNDFVVLHTHYTADPSRRGDWKFRASKKYGGLLSWRWRKEQEVDFEAMEGALVFENWNDGAHLIRPRAIPDHWPRWIMIDPGWTNPTSILWVAMDVDTPPNVFGFHPVHVYREFYKPRHTAAFVAVVCRDWSLMGDAKSLEWVEAIVLDPMAKQEHQGAQDGELVNEVAESFHSKFTTKLESLGWSVPVDTGNNLKDAAIEELIARLANFWVLNDVPLYDDSNRFREPTLDELAAGAAYVGPTLVIHAGCVNTANEMRKYRFRDWSAGDVAERHNAPERPVDKDDHSVTNLIRFINLLRAARVDGGTDLSDFTPRRRPQRWRPSDEEIMRREHESAPQRHRQRPRLR
ncbi:MAG TPA: hypothetical protein VFJ82_01570 [Longimicrobium sp.]|nr:hypothetical protein [Longimicrobium sp.]